MSSPNQHIHGSREVATSPSSPPSGSAVCQVQRGLPGTPEPLGLPGPWALRGLQGRMARAGRMERKVKREMEDREPRKPGVNGREGVFGKAGRRGLKGLRGTPGGSGKRGPKGELGDVGQQGAPGGCNCGSAARSAFSVAVTKSYPKERLPIRFSRIMLNEGNHYNASSGKFVCAVPGVYYFTYDITLANKHLAIGLLHNGQYKIRTFDANTGNHDVASGSTVLQLQQSDQVWLQIFYAEQNGLFFDPFWTDSTFTGFLLYLTRSI
ncbi:hypothetical protein F7725_009984 [Dissostichus mawsoni]|uniref:C1q domain-containing protein n=1 Tax=Dissostichus mawsoni TaxID=36200 RepID=A0A7J5XM96_DISMA|nr:hypothetical protein F7725_009984 [Dissostichus mawsoni]